MCFKALFGNDSFFPQTIKVFYKQYLSSGASGFPLQADDTLIFLTAKRAWCGFWKQEKVSTLDFFFNNYFQFHFPYQLHNNRISKINPVCEQLAHPASSLPKIHPFRLSDSEVTFSLTFPSPSVFHTQKSFSCNFWWALFKTWKYKRPPSAAGAAAPQDSLSPDRDRAGVRL